LVFTDFVFFLVPIVSHASHLQITLLLPDGFSFVPTHFRFISFVVLSLLLIFIDILVSVC